MKVKEESEKVGLKLNIQKTKIMASGPITSWQIDEETIGTVRDYGAPKSLQMVTCSHEIKRCLLLGRKVMTNLVSILKSRDITLSTKVCLVKAMVFPVVMYGWMWELDYKEIWAPKNWCFWTIVLEKTLESPLDCKEIKPVNHKVYQSCIFTGRSDVEAETPILWPPDAKSWLIWKDPDVGKRLKAGGEGDDRRWDGWMASLTQCTWVWVDSRSWWWTDSWRAAVHGVAKSQTRLSDWTELNWTET